MLRGSRRPGKRGAPVHRSLPSSHERSWQVSSTSKSCSSTSRSIRCGPPRRHDGLSSRRHRDRRARERQLRDRGFLGTWRVRQEASPASRLGAGPARDARALAPEAPRRLEVILSTRQDVPGGRRRPVRPLGQPIARAIGTMLRLAHAPRALTLVRRLPGAPHVISREERES